MASKSLTKNVVESNAIIVGIDIGYGKVKAVCEDRKVMFPAVASHATTLKFQSDEIIGSYPGDLLTDVENDEEWFIGDLAVAQTRNAELIQLKGRDNNTDSNTRFRLHMLWSALAKLLPHQNGKIIKVILATGLPVDHMSDAKALKEAFIGRHIIHTNNADFVVDIDTCYVMPQPKGTIYRFMYTDQGGLNEAFTFDRVAVWDWGNFTIDVTVDQNGMFINDESGSAQGGVFTVQKRIENLFEERYGAKPSYKMLETILHDKKALVQNVMVDFSEWVADAVKPMRATGLSLAGRLLDKALEIEQIYMVGGGSNLVDDVVSVYPQAVIVDDPQFSNALGYRNFAKFKNRA